MRSCDNFKFQLDNSLDIRQTDLDDKHSEANEKTDLVVSYLEEVKKRKRLSALYGEMSAKNEGLKDEIESLQDQQRALIQLL